MIGIINPQNIVLYFSFCRIPYNTYPEVYADSTITVKQFVKYLEKQTGTDVKTKAAGKLTNEAAADLLVQAYHQINGCISVNKYHRISEIKKADKKYRSFFP